MFLECKGVAETLQILGVDKSQSPSRTQRLWINFVPHFFIGGNFWKWAGRVISANLCSGKQGFAWEGGLQLHASPLIQISSLTFHSFYVLCQDPSVSRFTHPSTQSAINNAFPPFVLKSVYMNVGESVFCFANGRPCAWISTPDIRRLADERALTEFAVAVSWSPVYDACPNCFLVVSTSLSLF
jgi:hypothetical protein